LKSDFAAQQPGDFTADGKTQTCASKPATGSSVGLLECFKDDLVFFRRNPDPSIGDRKRDNFFSLIQRVVVITPTFSRHTSAHIHAALFSEFERIRQQILQDLLQTL